MFHMYSTPCIYTMFCVLVIQRACSTQKHRLHDLSWQLLPFAGPNGVCVREGSRQSGADIKSWTDKHKASLDNKHRPCRNFLVQVKTNLLQQSSRHLLTPQLLLPPFCPDHDHWCAACKAGIETSIIEYHSLKLCCCMGNVPIDSIVQLQGSQQEVVLALDILCDAVERYKALCEGRYSGNRLFIPNSASSR